MYIPIMLKVKNKKVKVFGGGPVAYRKSKKFLDEGAEVTVISPDFIKKLEDIKDFCIKRPYKKSDLLDVDIVIAATNDRNINLEISSYCEDKGILVNVADSKEESSFILPSKIDTGGLVISFSTLGRYPALSRSLRMELEDKFSIYYKEYLDLLELYRQKILKENPENKLELIRQALDYDKGDLEKLLY